MSISKRGRNGTSVTLDLVLGKSNWQITAAGMMAITLVLAFGMVWVSTRSEFVPYVVEVDELGYAIGSPSSLTVAPLETQRTKTVETLPREAAWSTWV